MRSTLSAAALYRYGPPPAAAPATRRVTDDCNRQWTVRELPAAAHRRAASLLFQCATPGVRPEVRRAARPLGALADEELRELLGHPGE